MSADAVVAGVRDNFEGRPHTAQVRVFAYHVDGAVDFLALVASRAPDEFVLDTEAFGAAAPFLDMVNRYALY